MPTITDQLGRVLQGRYRLDAGLGTGSSAHVYLAFDLQLARSVAVKLVHPGLSNDESFLRRFRAEAQTAAALNHPNIVQIYDWGEENGEPYLVLEYLGGGTLRDLFDRGVYLGPEQVARIGAQAARALEYAHRRGLVHRDIKPANLCFDEDGVVHVADFGLARALADAAWTEPAGALFGTARYASPEQINGQNIDERSDVYSLALVCYEALVGKAPFRADTALGTLMARVATPLPMSPALGPLAPILAAAAMIEPLARLDARALAADLELLSTTLPTPQPLPIEKRPISVPVGERRNRSDHTELVEVIEDGAFVSVSRKAVREQRMGRSRRRMVRRFAIVFAVLIVLAGGATAYARFGVFGHSVPRVAGLPVASATKKLVTAGLVVGRKTTSYSNSVPANAVISQSLAPGTHLRAGTLVNLVVSRGHAPVPVPSVVGLTRDAAITRITAGHLKAKVQSVYDETIAAGNVVINKPATGTAAFESAVLIEVSRGPKPRTIPALANESWSDASSALTALRLVPHEILRFSSTVPNGEVISTNPLAGTTGITVGHRVGVTVSKGPQQVAIPIVAGETIAQAVAALQAVGLVVTEQVGPPFATSATTTQPAPGTQVPPGSDVILYVA